MKVKQLKHALGIIKHNLASMFGWEDFLSFDKNFHKNAYKIGHSDLVFTILIKPN